jgi:predicted MPP superfamily phosphohydrolase
MNWDLPFQASLMLLWVGVAWVVGRDRVRLFRTDGVVDVGRVVLWANALALVLAFGFAHDFFHFTRLCAWWVFGHVPLQLIAWGYHCRRQRHRVAIAGILAAALLAIAVDAFLIEPHSLQVRTLTWASDRVKAPLRIVVMADIQTDHMGDYERSAFDTAIALQPDLVLMPGDFLQIYDQTRPAEVAKFREQLNRLSPRLGTWAVRGNIDPLGSQGLFDGTPVRYLEQTQAVRINDELWLLGLLLEDSFDPNFSWPNDEPGLRIVMGHAPDFALGTPAGELMIAGHTHGGQVQLPVLGPLLTLSRVPSAMGGGGLTALGDGRAVLVSRGIGMERGYAPRLRFLCRPEIVVIDVEPVR